MRTLQTTTDGPAQPGDYVPAPYKGLQKFHKYWGKKPADLMSLLVQTLTHPGSVVADPFVGYGAIARECALSGRHFIGFDINPVAIRIARIISDPPSALELKEAFLVIRDHCRERIEDTYALSDGINIASHYLWDGTSLEQVWTRGKRRRRVVHSPTTFDYNRSADYAGWQSRNIRDVTFFQNSRINAKPTMGIGDLFTGRALYNIDILLDSIHSIENPRAREGLLLCLTSAMGQMSRMVFTINRRGKSSGHPTGRIEVGSWVIGYWRPTRHFEINVWNCFELRSKKFIKACHEVTGTVNQSSYLEPTLWKGDCQEGLSRLMADSVDLVITDPPHADRIPYLELSEMWNAVLGEEVCFEDEIVISNAKERGKTSKDYTNRMSLVFTELRRVLRPGGLVILLYNSRKTSDWSYIRRIVDATCWERVRIEYIGAFDCQYSAGSVVQDNRAGGLKSDFGLVFRKTLESTPPWEEDFSQLAMLPGWTKRWPGEGR